MEISEVTTIPEFINVFAITNLITTIRNWKLVFTSSLREDILDSVERVSNLSKLFHSIQIINYRIQRSAVEQHVNDVCLFLLMVVRRRSMYIHVDNLFLNYWKKYLIYFDFIGSVWIELEKWKTCREWSSLMKKSTRSVFIICLWIPTSND